MARHPGSRFHPDHGDVTGLHLPAIRDTRPGYQDGTAGIGATRGVPDVAADASARTGMAVAIVEGGEDYALTEATGTSAGAPFWAGLVALAGQYAGHGLGAVYHQAFHDITAGDITVRFPSGTIEGYPAAAGWAPSPAGAAPTPRCSSRC